ncbi:MAG: Trp biosynthesis-associated membrane protein [Actinomycetales bacterium]|nr:Trp biosynthesis-associated membrane protein [Actinomycetales bacterium]
MASTVRPFLADRRGYIVGLSSMLMGSALAWWSASATWVLVERSLLGDSTSSEMTNVQAVGLLAVSGGSVVSIAAAAPIIGFAGLAGVIGSRGWLRRSVGAVVAIAGIVLCASAVRFLSTIAVGSPVPGGVGGSGDQNVVAVSTVWPVVAIVAGLLVLAGGLLTTSVGHRWPTLGAGYERKSDQPRDAWDALDAGLDPTVDEEGSLGSGIDTSFAKRPEPEPER